MTNIGGEGLGLWDEADQFFYDVLHLPGGHCVPLRVRSMVGLIPLFAVEVLQQPVLEQVPGFRSRLTWFLKYRPDLAALVSRWHQAGTGDSRLLSLLRGHRMKQLLRRMLDETEFLSDYGVRALSKFHEMHPYVFEHGGQQFSVGYSPAESTTAAFGGNSNWRGPVWMPVNYLLVEVLRVYHRYLGSDFKVEYPTGSGRMLDLEQVADDIAARLIGIFLDRDGRRPVFGAEERFHEDHAWHDLIPFHEYFNG